ncbi:hypothetical protein GJAV_G00200980 [Gymnothorax javanicus]|nr:hypothetical protein GJAV_G00200980 [Gymnothorax javanicus]
MTRERDDTRRIVQAILQSNIPHDLVLWLPSNHRDYVKTLAPGFRHVYADSKKMSNESGDQLNINYAALDPEDIAEQKKDNKSINLWVVNEPWLFSLLWCAGASSVTTNACHRLKDITEPEWTLSPSTYRIIWISVEVVSLLMMIAIYLLLRKRDLRVRAAGCAGRIRELRPFL